MTGQISRRATQRFLRLSKSAVKHLRKRGVLTPVVRPHGWGQAYIFDTDEVRALWLRSGRARRRRGDPLPEPQQPHERMTVKEAAERLNIKRTCVYALIYKGMLTRVEDRAGKQKLWVYREEVERLKIDPERVAARTVYEMRRAKVSLPREISEEERAELKSQMWLNATEAARYLGCSSPALNAQRRKGKVIAQKIRGRVWVLRESLDALLADVGYLKHRGVYREANTEAKQLERTRAYRASILRVEPMRGGLRSEMRW